jgi:Cro/C1-type HTH DNA-binding domain
VTIKWTLRVTMAEQGIFSMAELGRRMAEVADYPLTPPALHRLAGGRDGTPPKEVKLATLNALLDALGFPATDFGVFRYEPPTDENRAAQPLVVNGDVRPVGRRPTGSTGRPPAKGAGTRLRRTPPPDVRTLRNARGATGRG